MSGFMGEYMDEFLADLRCVGQFIEYRIVWLKSFVSEYFPFASLWIDYLPVRFDSVDESMSSRFRWGVER